MRDPPAIHCAGLTRRFAGRPVLDHLDFTLESGSVIGLLGANGAGKTTLIRSILGLLSVDSGSCKLLGEPSTNLSVAVRARIGYVPQRSNQFEWLTGRSMFQYIAQFYPAFDWACAEELSERWKLSLKSLIGTLSPGQQQRLSIVRAMAARPDVLVLDEPIASLDPATRIAVIDELSAERSQRPLSILFSSHLIGDLERLCTHFAILDGGKIAVLESVGWFQDLARVCLSGPASLLATLTTSDIALLRKASAGKRIVVIRRDELPRLMQSLPAGVSASAGQTSLESIVSEWMR